MYLELMIAAKPDLSISGTGNINYKYILSFWKYGVIIVCLGNSWARKLSYLTNWKCQKSRVPEFGTNY